MWTLDTIFGRIVLQLNKGPVYWRDRLPQFIQQGKRARVCEKERKQGEKARADGNVRLSREGGTLEPIPLSLRN